jgi:aarF domain-containing kinase
MQVHAHEIFVDGTFNGDPHPGNIMLLPDGRLGLIDYGQVKHIDLATRMSYARLVIALDEQHQEEVFRIVQQELGCRSKYNNPVSSTS